MMKKIWIKDCLVDASYNFWNAKLNLTARECHHIFHYAHTHTYIYKTYSQSITIVAVFMKKQINYEWNIHFLENYPLGIKHTYFRKFVITESLWDSSFYMVWSVDVLFLLMSSTRSDFTKKQSYILWNKIKSFSFGKGFAFVQFRVLSKYVCPFGWGWRICWLHLCRRVRP